MREDIRDYQRQLENQRETLISKREGDQVTRTAMTEKVKLLNEAMDENRVCLFRHLVFVVSSCSRALSVMIIYDYSYSHHSQSGSEDLLFWA